MSTDGLDKNESATLWSRDDDSDLRQSTNPHADDGQRTALQQVADGTDYSYKRPPDTAVRWTRHDFQDLDAGPHNTTVHPSHASLEDGSFIKDAHSTIFSVHPSTRGHLAPNQTPLYVPSNGTVRGFIDYRVQIPNSSAEAPVTWTLQEHNIEAIRLTQDGKLLGETGGSHTPTIPYDADIARTSRFTLEAEINTRLKLTTPDGVTYRNETLIVSDTVDVSFYNLSVSAYYAEYPDGDLGVTVFQTQPWQGYSLTANENEKVRGIWRFYTARDRHWETLLETDRSGTVSTASPAVPVYVHAYPSRIGPRAEPIRHGPELIDTWGGMRSSPSNTLGDNIQVEAVNRPYSTTYGIAIRTDNTKDALDTIRVTGIVRGVNSTLPEPEPESTTELRRSTLSIEVIERDQSHAVLRIELLDSRSGDPIVLSGDSQSPAGQTAREGYITVADQRIETNSSGVAIISVNSPGIYTARYHPGSWFTHSPAYVSDTARARWHPLGTVDGWFSLFTEAIWRSVPFLTVFLAGHRLLLLLGFTHTSRRNP